MTTTLLLDRFPLEHKPAEDLEALAFNGDMRALEIRNAVEAGVSMQAILERGRYTGRWDAAYVRGVLTAYRMSTVQLDAIAPAPRPPIRVVHLHPVQVRILDALCAGVATTELRETLADVSEHSLKHHLRVLPDRVEAVNITQAVAWALSGRVRVEPVAG